MDQATFDGRIETLKLIRTILIIEHLLVNDEEPASILTVGDLFRFFDRDMISPYKKHVKTIFSGCSTNTPVHLDTIKGYIMVPNNGPIDQSFRIVGIDR